MKQMQQVEAPPPREIARYTQGGRVCVRYAFKGDIYERIGDQWHVRTAQGWNKCEALTGGVR